MTTFDNVGAVREPPLRPHPTSSLVFTGITLALASATYAYENGICSHRVGAGLKPAPTAHITPIFIAMACLSAPTVILNGAQRSEESKVSARKSVPSWDETLWILRLRLRMTFNADGGRAATVGASLVGALEGRGLA